MAHSTQEDTLFIYWFIVKDTNDKSDEELPRMRSRKFSSVEASVPMELE